MSLKIKCFATVIQDSHLENDGLIEVHSRLYMLSVSDFAECLGDLHKESGVYSINIIIGDKNSERNYLWKTDPILTKYSYEIKETTPVPLANQPISPTVNEVKEFRSSRFWIFQKYFFVTNRSYSEDEASEVKIKICYVVNNFKNKLVKISNALKDTDFN